VCVCFVGFIACKFVLWDWLPDPNLEEDWLSLNGLHGGGGDATFSRSIDMFTCVLCGGGGDATFSRSIDMSTCVLCGGCGDATFSRATDMSTCVLCGRGWGATF